MLSFYKPKRTVSKKHVVVGFLAALALLMPATAAKASRLTSSEASLLTTMNAVRQSHHLPALRIDFHLVRAARGHSADMMRRQYFAHGSVAGRVVFLGSPPFATPVLESILASPHKVLALVAKPDKPSGRGRKLEESPLVALAKDRDVRILRPATTRDPEFVQTLRDLDPQVLVVASWGEILGASAIACRD